MKDRIIKPLKCTTCGQRFYRKEVVCWNCACCQKCKQKNNSKFRSFCYHCNYFIDQPPANHVGRMVTIHHRPRH